MQTQQELTSEHELSEAGPAANALHSSTVHSRSKRPVNSLASNATSNSQGNVLHNSSSAHSGQVMQFVKGKTVTDRENFTALQRQRILERNKKRKGNDGFYTCESCGFQHKQKTYATRKGRRLGDGGFQVDHRKAASKGGRALARNSSVLCGTCNTSKGARKAPKRYGKKKYAGIHRGAKTKDYQRVRKNY